jgi:hypothetical protein
VLLQAVLTGYFNTTWAEKNFRKNPIRWRIRWLRFAGYAVILVSAGRPGARKFLNPGEWHMSGRKKRDMGEVQSTKIFFGLKHKSNRIIYFGTGLQKEKN